MDYMNISKGRGRFYSNLNKGTDSTIEAGYMSSKVGRAENSTVTTKLKLALLSLQEQISANLEVTKILEELIELVSKEEITESESTKISQLVEEVIDKGGIETDQLKESLDLLNQKFEKIEIEIEPIPIDWINDLEQELSAND